MYIEDAFDDEALLYEPRLFIGIYEVSDCPLKTRSLKLQRLQSLGFGFETFACQQKTDLSRLTRFVKGQPDTSNAIFGFKGISILHF